MTKPVARALLVGLLAAAAACGKKGAPLAPLHLVPTAPTEVEIRRSGTDVRLQFLLPPGNANGAGPSTLDRVQVYAVTLAPGMAAPPNRVLLTPAFLVGTVAVKPPPVEGEPAPASGAAPDTRPSPGDRATFVEPLTPAALMAAAPPAESGKRAAETARVAGAALVTAALAPAAARSAPTLLPALALVPTSGLSGAAASFAVAASAAVTAAIPAHAVRLYAVQGITKTGRPGQASARVELPIVPTPPTPAGVRVNVTETNLAVTWTVPEPAAAVPAATPPVTVPAVTTAPATAPVVVPPAAVPPAPAAAEAVPPAAAALPAVATFNVYGREGGSPLNAAPLATPPFERPGVTWGTEECFVVRAVEKSGAAVIESDASPPVCVTPRDTFPPAAPKALSLVAGPGTINLSWDAGTEADLAGYLVLRGAAPDGPMQPLMPAPITATNYEDRALTPGVRYAYTVVALDKAAPPNRSAPSVRVEETAR